MVLVVGERLGPIRIMLTNVKDGPLLKGIRLRIEGSAGGHCDFCDSWFDTGSTAGSGFWNLAGQPDSDRGANRSDHGSGL